VPLYNRPTTLLLEMWTVQLMEILKICHWEWYAYIEIDVFFPAFQCYDVMTK